MKNKRIFIIIIPLLLVILTFISLDYYNSAKYNKYISVLNKNFWFKDNLQDSIEFKIENNKLVLDKDKSSYKLVKKLNSYLIGYDFKVDKAEIKEVDNQYVWNITLNDYKNLYSYELKPIKEEDIMRLYSVPDLNTKDTVFMLKIPIQDTDFSVPAQVVEKQDNVTTIKMEKEYIELYILSLSNKK